MASRIAVSIFFLYLCAAFGGVRDANSVFRMHAWDAKNGSVSQGNGGPSGSCVTGIGAGDHLRYDGLDFGAGHYDVFMATLAAPLASAGKTLEIRIGGVTGTLIGALAIGTTGGLDRYHEQYAAIDPVTGVHDVYIVFPEAPGADFNWFTFGIDSHNETEEERLSRLDWWREARFGQFIHFGAYSHLEGVYDGWETDRLAEWIMYDQDTYTLRISVDEYETIAAAPLNPVDFDPEAWVGLMKAAGQKYVVITAKHHDGFSMFDTDVSHFHPYDIVDCAAYGKDIIAELAEECKKQGVRFGTYYSILDWRHEDLYGAEWGSDYAVRYYMEMKEQLMELVSNYDPEIMWFDAGWAAILRDLWESGVPDSLYRFLRVLKSEMIINDRIAVHNGGGDGDYFTPERGYPKSALDIDWESCMTHNRSWGYKRHDDNWNSIWSVVMDLAKIASRGGNLLFNVGPDSKGVIPKPSVDLLELIGWWLQEGGNGEFLYGTSAGPAIMADKTCTQRPGILYFWLNIGSWPGDGVFSIPAISNTITKCYLLSDRETILSHQRNGDEISITLEGNIPVSFGAVIAVEYEGTLDDPNGGVTEIAALPETQKAYGSTAGHFLKVTNSSIQYEIASSHLRPGDRVSITMHDIRGRLIRRIVEAPAVAGRHTVGLSRALQALPRGVYTYTMSVGKSGVSQKLIIP